MFSTMSNAHREEQKKEEEVFSRAKQQQQKVASSYANEMALFQRVFIGLKASVE